MEANARFLESSSENGIRGNEMDLITRKRASGSNTYQKPPPKGLIHFILQAFEDTTILIIACAALSLTFGIEEHGLRERWYQGGIIFRAVFLVVAVSASSNFRQGRQFDKLSKISNDIRIDVVRDRRRQKVFIFNAVVGDVFLTIGDQVLADG